MNKKELKAQIKELQQDNELLQWKLAVEKTKNGYLKAFHDDLVGKWVYDAKPIVIGRFDEGKQIEPVIPTSPRGQHRFSVMILDDVEQQEKCKSDFVYWFEKYHKDIKDSMILVIPSKISQ